MNFYFVVQRLVKQKDTTECNATFKSESVKNKCKEETDLSLFQCHITIIDPP